MPKITKRVVDALMPSETAEVLVWDSELKGFGVRVMPQPAGAERGSAAASYIVKYRNREGRQRKLTLGRTNVLTADEARNLARQRLGEVAQGGDPSAERSQIRQSLTVAELCDLYLADAAHRVKATTLSTDRSRIDAHVKPLIGSRTVLSLTPQDIAKMQADIIAGRTAKPRTGRGGVTTGGKGAAARTVGMFGTVLEFAVSRRVIKENPARGVERPAYGQQRRFLSLEEIARLGAALRAMVDEGERGAGFAATRFLLLSGCRKMEALTLRTTWIDRRAGCIRFPDTKSGPQVRAMGKAALDESEAVAEAGWAFPSAREGSKKRGHFVGLPKVLSRACKRAKLVGVTVHVLRHSFAATAAEMGFSELTIAGLLGHTVPGVTARYAHIADSALVSAAGKVSGRILAALDGRAAAKVVRLEKRQAS